MTLLHTARNVITNDQGVKWEEEIVFLEREGEKNPFGSLAIQESVHTEVHAPVYALRCALPQYMTPFPVPYPASLFPTDEGLTTMHV